MDRIKSITFDKKVQDNLPQHIKDKMKVDRDNARKKTQSKGLNIPIVSFNEVELCDICKQDVKIITGKICEHRDCIRYR